MADRQNQLGKDSADDSDSRTSSVPLLGEGFAENGTRPKDEAEPESAEITELDTKTGKRRFWGLGKRKEEDKTKKKRESGLTNTSSTPSMAQAQKGTMRPASPLPGIGSVPVLANTMSYPYAAPPSPGMNLRSSSPAPPSPASSQIFERNVQDEGLAQREQPQIPGHITTEDHIPPVLDASSEAITNDNLDPDDVEIVMHSAHQPAAITVSGTGSSDQVAGISWPDDLVAHPDNDDAASNYGALDSTDVRRLSFISFADVVHAEQTEHPGGVAQGTISPVVSHNRSPSPMRSPLSSQGLGGSPVMSETMSSRGLETSPNRGGKGLGSPLPGHSPPAGGELTIETMRQALRKTGSGDLSGARSAPLSATGGEDGTFEHSFK